MTRTTRRLIFYAMVALFLLATPPTILYSIGYSFDWQRKSLVQTGGLFLKSSPEGAQILIDGKEKKTTPRLISRLIPKTYKITLSKDGYQAWEKSLEIKPRLVEEARSIILFPQNIQSEIASSSVSSIRDFLQTPEEKELQIQAIKVASSTAGWLYSENNLYFINNTNFILYRTDLNGYIKEQLSQQFLPRDHYSISIGKNSQLMVLGQQSGSLFWLNKNTQAFEKIAEQVKGCIFSGDGKKIAYWNNNEIWINYIEDILVQPYKKAGDKELITRHSQIISQVIFYPNNEYLAYVNDDQIKIIELDSRDKRNIINFISAPSPQIYFDQPSSYFYYLTDGQLFRIKLEF